MNKKGKISISRYINSGEIGIDIHDEQGILVRLVITPEEFGNAIVGKSEREITIIKSR